MNVSVLSWRATAIAVLFASATLAIAQQPRSGATAPRPSASLDRVVPLERVIAVVNDEAITQWEVSEQKRMALQQMATQKMAPPAPDALEKQVLERLITQRILHQYAKETGVRVDDLQVERAIQRIAQDNKLSLDDFQKAVEREGIPFPRFREDVRNEIVVQRLREREIDSRTTVSDAEVDNFLATMAVQTGGDTEYLISHILVVVPEQATPEQIDAKRRRAEEALNRIRSGADFAQVAAGYSDASDALQGGSLGWRPPARLPTVFAEPVRNMKPGDISGVLRSASGFHIVRLQETRDRNVPTVVEQTRARHILIKVSEVTSESEAKLKIDRVKERIDRGSRFDDQAKLNSEDGTAARGGDLGWLSPGDTVPDFERAMNALKVDEISAPIRTPFGWHLIQVQERRTQDVTADRKRDQARLAMRQRKSDEAFQEWIRQMRDRAYVEFKSDER